jgi:hypothetical protein
MEPGAKGSFQSVKLQRPGRTTVCSHSARDMATKVALSPIIIISCAQSAHLCVCEQLDWADQNEGPKTISLAAICAPIGPRRNV